MSRVEVVEVSYCTFCAHGDHRRCRGVGRGTAKKVGVCACSLRSHVPDVETAAAMRVFLRPDRVGAPVEVLATEWRKVTA